MSVLNFGKLPVLLLGAATTLSMAQTPVLSQDVPFGTAPRSWCMSLRDMWQSKIDNFGENDLSMVAQMEERNCHLRGVYPTLRLRVVNKTSDYVTELYVSNSSESSWGDNILDRPVAPGQEGDARYVVSSEQNGCAVDVRAVGDQGKKLEVFGLSNCLETGILTLKD